MARFRSTLSNPRAEKEYSARKLLTNEGAILLFLSDVLSKYILETYLLVKLNDKGATGR